MKQLFLLLMFPLSMLGGQHHIEGYIRDADTKESLPGVMVMWEGTEEATFTDLNGYFQLEESLTSQILFISLIGFKSKKIEISNEHQLVIELKTDNNIAEVEVIVEKPASTISMYNAIKTETLGIKELGKAACCNLSESFETNPTVDASFTDAVTGTKQIQLLGLAGPYSLISNGNIPTLTGNSSVFGLDFVPGQWLNSIQLVKGTGSIVNGYSSIAGQINTEYKDPFKGDKLFFNIYGNTGTRLEINAIANMKVNDNLASGLFIQADNGFEEIDNNKDGFMDNQLGPKVVLMNIWRFHSDSSN